MYRVRGILRDAHALTAHQFAARARPSIATPPHGPVVAERPGATSEEGTRRVMTGDRSDLYAVLGLTSQATEEQIRRAYRTLMRQHHPDTRVMGASDDASSNTTLQQAISAYTVLGDPARRARYDHRTTPDRSSTPTRIPTVLPFPRGHLARPPILAGPVRWHRSR